VFYCWTVELSGTVHSAGSYNSPFHIPLSKSSTYLVSTTEIFLGVSALEHLSYVQHTIELLRR